MIAGGPRAWFHRSAMAGMAAALVLPAGPAWSQTLGQGADDGISTWRIVAVLALCLALAVAAAFALRSRLGGRGLSVFSGARQPRRLQLVETLRLSHQIDLCIVQCDGRETLVAAGAQGARLLAHLPMGRDDPPPGAGT